MNFLEPSPNLVPSEVPASGHHGFVKWGHDAKIPKIGVIPTRGSPGQGKANGSQDRRQDPGLMPVGIEKWGRLLTTRGGEIGVPMKQAQAQGIIEYAQIVTNMQQLLHLCIRDVSARACLVTPPH